MLDLSCPYENNMRIDFSGAKIQGNVIILHGIVLNLANIGGSLYIGNVDSINDLQANQNIVYGCSAIGAKIGKDICIKGCYILGPIDFKKSSASGLAIVNNAWSDQAELDISSLKIGTLLDMENNWPKNGRIFFNNFVYDEIDNSSPSDAVSRIRWLHLQSTSSFLPQPYEQLAGVLRKMGREDDAIEVLIAKNDDRAQKMAGAKRMWWLLKGLVIGYGYKSYRALYISLGFILFGWFLFRWAYYLKIVCPTERNKAFPDHPHVFSDEYPPFNAFIFSLENFVPLLNLEMGKDWALNSEVKKQLWRLNFSLRSAFRFYLFAHIIIGWVLTSLWIGSLTGLVKS
ncbi:MAG TPA: hypothetical protein VG347_20570 [Verrucomicrobiae bacterium]|nr:hypothetical protein [Verrucomicrobiae bacterium]